MMNCHFFSIWSAGRPPRPMLYRVAQSSMRDARHSVRNNECSNHHRRATFSAMPGCHRIRIGGARVAVSIVVNFEEGAEFSVTDGDTENEAVYEIEQPLLGHPNPAIDSHFEYGSRAGWWRIMAMLEQHNALATVSSSGRGSTWIARRIDIAKHWYTQFPET